MKIQKPNKELLSSFAFEGGAHWQYYVLFFNVRLSYQVPRIRSKVP